MNTLSNLLPDDYEISQGFVVDCTSDKWISNQCDIIIHRKDCGVVRIFGYTKLIDVKYVDVVIEIKSSISEKTFHSTLKAFERLASKGVVSTFIFVYGRLTRRSLSNWLFSYHEISTDTSIITSETSKFDWPDKEWLPKGIDFYFIIILLLVFLIYKPSIMIALAIWLIIFMITKIKQLAVYKNF